MSRGGRDRFPTEEATRVDVRAVDGQGDDLDITALLPELDDRPGPARRVPSARSAAMVRNIVERALDLPAGLPAPQLPPRTRPASASRHFDDNADADPRDLLDNGAPRDDLERGRRQRVIREAYRRRSTRRVAWMAAAMVVALVSGAAAAVWVTARKPAVLVPTLRAPPPRPRPMASQVPATGGGATGGGPAIVEPVAPSIDMPAEVVDPRRPRPSADNLPDDAPPADIMKLANQRRKEKRWRDADALYQRVITRHAGSDAAVIATVASAGLHLDRLDDPAGGLRLYRRALRLRPSGVLAEESRWGVAEALRALGDTDAEAEALRAFAAAHPDSPNARAAQRRLSEIAPVR